MQEVTPALMKMVMAIKLGGQRDTIRIQGVYWCDKKAIDGLESWA